MAEIVWTPTIHKAEHEVECDIADGTPLHLTVWRSTSSWSYSVKRVRSSPKYMVTCVYGKAKTKSLAMARAIRIASEYHMWNRVC